jgi:hypothetical protein
MPWDFTLNALFLAALMYNSLLAYSGTLLTHSSVDSSPGILLRFLVNCHFLAENKPFFFYVIQPRNF